MLKDRGKNGEGEEERREGREGMMKEEVNDVGLFFFSFSREDCDARSPKIVNHIQHKVIFFPCFYLGVPVAQGNAKVAGPVRGEGMKAENIRQP